MSSKARSTAGARCAPALLDPPAPSYRDLTFGIQRIVWGLFKKMVVADRAYVYVRAVFDDWTQYSGAAVIAGVVMYTLELYAEFSGCMDIALGSAELFGVHLAENFRQPFFCALGGRILAALAHHARGLAAGICVPAAVPEPPAAAFRPFSAAKSSVPPPPANGRCGLRSVSPGR